MPQTAELWSHPGNFAIIQLPERAYPGVVVQGDTLNALIDQIQTMRALLQANDLQALAEEIEDLQEQLSSARVHYEQVCSGRGVGLPYAKQAP